VCQPGVAALEAGDLVAATARRPEQLAGLSPEYGDSIWPIALDVTDAAAAQAAITEARERLGQLDVIVNNAGYANVSPIETTTNEDFRAQTFSLPWTAERFHWARPRRDRHHQGRLC
jgi:NADP-dependent 3-hydroxy acid dehydrogenase YdfG